MKKHLSVLMVFLALALQACYGNSTDIGSGQDASTDPVRDASSDPVRDPSTEVTDHGGFTVAPEKHIPSSHVEAAMPSLASQEGSAALVYRSADESGSSHVVFQRLDPLGETVGSAQIVASGNDLAGSLPHVSSAGDGTFLVCAVRTSPRSLIMARVGTDGAVSAVTETPIEDGVMDPISGPVLEGGSAFVVAGYSGGSPGEVALFRFDYPGLTFDAANHMVSFDMFGIQPVLMNSMYGVELIVNSLSPAGSNSAIEHVYTDSMTFSGAITTFGGDGSSNPISAHHASMGETTWYGFNIKDTGSSWYLHMFDDVGDEHYSDPFWSSSSFPGSHVHWHMESAMTDLPTGGATFSILNSGSWEVWAFVIDGGGPPAPRDIFPVSNEDPSYAPNPTITWTDGGFLLAWDRACSGGRTCLSSIFIEVD